MEHRMKIVLTDTNEEIRELMRTALERTGRFTVVGATGDGAQALQMVQELKPDMLLLDLILPGLDGLSILRRLGRRRDRRFWRYPILSPRM